MPETQDATVQAFKSCIIAPNHVGVARPAGRALPAPYMQVVIKVQLQFIRCVDILLSRRSPVLFNGFGIKRNRGRAIQQV